MNKNIILAALILVVIFLISQRQTENFGLYGSNGDKDSCKHQIGLLSKLYYWFFCP